MFKDYLRSEEEGGREGSPGQKIINVEVVGYCLAAENFERLELND